MASKPQNNQDQQQAQAMQKHLEQLAQQWHQKLQDPGIRQMVESGQMQVSPLVKDLLDAFPQAKKK